MTKRIAEMTPEQLARELQRRKSDAYRDYHREYRRYRYATDPEFRERLKQQKRTRARERYHNDPEYRERLKARRRSRRAQSAHLHPCSDGVAPSLAVGRGATQPSD